MDSTTSKIPAIGIDLGTTYSCVGVFRNGKIEIITNEHGKRTTSNCVAFTDSETLVGGDATHCYSKIRPENTIFNAKRLIGRQYYDKQVRHDLKQWPFQVLNEDGKPSILYDFEGEVKSSSYSPEQVSAMILKKIKHDAEVYLGEAVQDAVITVPAYFNDAQRQATKNAGIIAGLNVVRILNEPTASALAYALEKRTETSANDGVANLLIFDLGGGALDVSVVTVNGKNLAVRSTAGDIHLGGEDFDNRLVNYFSAEFKRKHKKDLTNSRAALRRLRIACEKAKRTLSTDSEAHIQINSLYEGKDFQSKITRSKFEELCSDLYKRTLDQVGKALEGAGLSNKDIHEVILVGGSTKIPKIQRILSEKMGGKKLNVSMNPDEAVAYGAAYQAAILSGVDDTVLQDVVIEDVIPRSVGIPSTGGTITRVIDRNTKIPHSATKTFTTYHDNQPTVAIQVYEGDKELSKENHHLGMFYLTGIPPAPKGVPQIDVCFDIDDSGILNISAVKNSSGATPTVTCALDAARLTESELSRMVQQARRYTTRGLVTHKVINRKGLKRKLSSDGLR